MDDKDQSKPLVILCKDYEHNVRCTNYSNEKISSWLPDYMKWVNTNVGRRMLDQMDVDLQHGEKLRLLGIGSGNGKVEYNFMARLLTKYPAIHNTAVDPSQTQLDLYKKLIEEKRDDLKGVEFEFRTETLSEYKQSCEKTGDTTKYHVISTLFCLYYEKEMFNMLAYMYDRLAQGGVLLVALESENCGVMKVEEHFKFAKEQWDGFYNSGDVCEYLEKRGIPYVICENEDNHHDFDITTCFDDSANGDLLLDYISDIMNFRKSVSPEVLKEFRDYLMGISSHRDGKVFLRHDADHIIVTKQ